MGKLKHIVLSGVSLLDHGIRYFDSWSQHMINEFGSEIEPHLEDIRLQAIEIHPSEGNSRAAKFPMRGKSLFMKRNVLVVDNEPNIVLSLKFLIAQHGYEVRTAACGDAALQAMNEQVPDLILMDSRLTCPDGYEVCQRIRTTPEWKDIPVILLTANRDDAEMQKGLAFGVVDYLTKPFATHELVTKVRGAFKMQHSQGPGPF